MTTTPDLDDFFSPSKVNPESILVKTEYNNPESEIDKLASDCHANICFTRTILNSIITCLGFIYVWLDKNLNSVAFRLTSIVVMIMTFVILSWKKDFKKLKQMG